MHISWWTLAIQSVNFLVLVWLLQRFLYKPVQDVIDNRRRLAAQSAAATEAAKREADTLKSQYEKALARIDAERKAVLETARAAIEAERVKILDAARQQASQTVVRSRAAAEEEKAATLESLRGEIADLATDLARTLLSHLAPSIPNAAILSRLETELAAMAPGDRQRLDGEISANGASLEIVTARALDAREKQDWQERLEKILDHPLHVVFTEDSALVAGAMMRLPHTLVRATWADQLEQAQEALVRGGRANLS